MTPMKALMCPRFLINSSGEDIVFADEMLLLEGI